MAHPVRGALFALCLASLAGAAPAAFAQAPKPAITQAFTKIRGIDAVVSRPAVPGAHSHVAIVIMHDESNSLDNLQAPILASRGYVVISTNARTGPDPEDHDTDWNNVLRDVRTVMTYAKALPGITKVVLMGHSSGAPLMASYQIGSGPARRWLPGQPCPADIRAHAESGGHAGATVVCGTATDA